MNRRIFFLLLLCSWSSLRSSVSVVDAKLLVWSSLEKDASPETIGDRTDDEKENTVHERLKSYHKQDEPSAAAQRGQHAIAPAKYVEFMLQYLRSSVREMTEYLYSSDDASQGSSSAYALFRRAQYKDMVAEPKDAWQGILSAFAALRTGYVGGVHSMIDGAYELGYGTISACISLFSGRGSSDDNPLSFAFLSELAYGMRRGATSAADGLYLFAAGAVVGTRNLMVGIYRTPEAMRSSQLGMLYYPRGKKQSATAHIEAPKQEVAVWDYYSLDYEDREIRLEEERMIDQDAEFQPHTEKKKETRRNVRRRHGVSVKDSKFYDILGVKPDANSKEIRSAYRREALRRHPDKQPAQQSSAGPGSALPDDPQIEGFLDLTEAYRILSNDASREAYDQQGLCFKQEESMLPEDGSHEAYVDLIDELFGVGAVGDYVGNIQIAPIVNEMFGFSEGSRKESVEIVDLRQRRRVVDIAKYLRDRTNTYVLGTMSMDEYTQTCRKEAQFILREGGEPAAFLRVIGRTLLEEADQRTGHLLPFVKRTISESSQRVKSSFGAARVYLPIYFRAALEGLVLGAFDKQDNDDTDDCSSRHKSKREPVDQDAVLDLLWQYVVNDTVATLRGACEKVFADRGTRDNSLAFVQTPSMMKYHKAKRAQAIRTLAREMLDVYQEHCKVSVSC